MVTWLFIVCTVFYVPAQQSAGVDADSISFFWESETGATDTLANSHDTQHVVQRLQQPAFTSAIDTLSKTGSVIAAAITDTGSLIMQQSNSSLRTVERSLAALQDTLLALQTSGCEHLSAEIALLGLRMDSLARRTSSDVMKETGLDSYHSDRFSLGYEEGISFRLKLFRWQKPDKRSAGLSFGGGYQRNQQTDMVHRTLHEAHVKLGLFHDLAVFKRVRLGVFSDVVEKMKQMEAPAFVMQVRYNRYSLWITRVRAGALLSIFCMEHFMISYRFGVEYLYSTTPYIVDPVTHSRLIPFGKGIHRFGLSGSDMGALEMLANNIGIYFYF